MPQTKTDIHGDNNNERYTRIIIITKDTQELSQSINHYENSLSATQTKILRKSCNQ